MVEFPLKCRRLLNQALIARHVNQQDLAHEQSAAIKSRLTALTSTLDYSRHSDAKYFSSAAWGSNLPSILYNAGPSASCR